jgi:hypothetical protein
MGKIRLRIGAFALLAGVFASAVALRATTQAGEKSDKESDLAAWIDQRIQAWQPTKDERRVDEIGWARDIRDALRLASEHKRPIFLFTYSGSADRENAMALQRC